MSQEMTAEGASQAWLNQQANQLAIFDSFLAELKVSELKARAGDSFAKLPEEVVCTKEIWGHFATYLAETYIIPKGRKNAGEKLHANTALAVWGGLIQQSERRFASQGFKEQASKVCLCLTCCARLHLLTRAHLSHVA